MTLHSFLQVASLVLFILAALTAWTWRPNWPSSYSFVLGWAGAACFTAATLL